jgi:HD superfamily phosphohydrolase
MAKTKNVNDSAKGADGTPQTANEDAGTQQEIFLPVHRYVRLWSEEIAIIDHPAFQRLRRLRQLGFAHVVFPGATHTRFEHSLGALHVAQRIITSANENHARASVERGFSARAKIDDWTTVPIAPPVGRLIRLAALLHDIGHLPYGHTLEDELHHLSQHDGLSRLQRVARLQFVEYDVDPKLAAAAQLSKPQGGWSLEALVNALYEATIAQLDIDQTPFEVLAHTICKAPCSEGGDKIDAAWEQAANAIDSKLPLRVCRDIVGDTICADFLDYIYRDWYHIGKPFTEDERLFQYMEVRRRQIAGGHESKFIINVGQLDKVRHDALTNILDLLQARYKLAETVIFHRTKLALIGVLDRCMLELRSLYRAVGLDISNDLLQPAESLLIDGSDDAIADVLRTLLSGASEHTQHLIRDAISKESSILAAAADDSRVGQADLGLNSGSFQGATALRSTRIEALIKKLKGRYVYSLAFKFRMCDFTGRHTPDNPALKKFLKLYADPDHRHGFLTAAEAILNLPEGSLVMYVPPDGEMNAKIAKVNVLIEGEVSELYSYEKREEEASLTRGALTAQAERFYELWSAQVFVDPAIWYSLSDRQRGHAKQVLKGLLVPCDDPVAVRSSIQGPLSVMQKAMLKAARSGSTDPRLQRLTEDRYCFPNGVPVIDGE